MASQMDSRVWVASRGFPARLLVGFVYISGLSIAFAFLVSGPALSGQDLLRALELSPVGGTPLGNSLAVSGFAIMFAIVLPLFGAVATLSALTIRIGVSSGGLRVVSVLGVRNVAWEVLRPPPRAPRGNWGRIGVSSSSLARAREFWTTREQARAILAHPNAPRGLFPLEYWAWLGVPPPPGTGGMSFRR
jgi:hypothetical protein